MYKVTCTTDYLDPYPMVVLFDNEDLAYDWISEEVTRRVSFHVEHSPYSIDEEEYTNLEEMENTLFSIGSFHSELSSQYRNETAFLLDNINFDSKTAYLIDIDAFLIELLDHVEDQGHYELSGMYTHSGNPIIYQPTNNKESK